ncbi:type I addiction module toxin, SymE family [Chitinophaga oryziterrae]|uniref:Type I addiction module toxin, SymE family n=1 Tax=Chitinophaga oryziterrae TaxID=1031224 RepID=A0A6N8J6Y1_9BACT|nr:SymE family type I addiction module toxin [Chitinophaga oryziterrae]MVT40793.1 type I addiction module toxin, SymE family [Chitinophaga oryziterrae]
MKTQKNNDVNNLKKTKMFDVEHNHNGSSLHLSGKWFNDAGFQPGDKAEVTIYKRTLIIRQVIND